MSYMENIANSNTAFGSGEYEEALKYAELAINEDSGKADGYYAAGKAYMSLEKPARATEYFSKALSIDKKNGNGYFLLGYSNALAEKTVEALQALTRALENECDEILKGQIYKIIALIDADKNDFENSLLNLKQAEQYVGVDPEILRQKAACYAGMQDYHQTLFTLNQIKLLQPDNYTAYSLAFHVFMDLNMYEEAKAELGRAEEFAKLTMDYYEDRIAFALMHDADKITEDKMPERYYDVLAKIDDALKKGKPNAQQVFEMYLRAAEIYNSMEDYDKALICLDSSVDPVLSFNSGFSVLINDDISENIVPENMLDPEEEEEKLEEMWENGEFENISEKIEEAIEDIDSDDPEEIAETMQKYLTPLDSISETIESSESEYKLEGDFEPDQLGKDMRNSMYLPIYEHKKDFENMFRKARELQSSTVEGNRYNGIYYELRVGKLRDDANWQKKYNDKINFWMKKMLEDPTDYLSAAYRTRCYIDLGNFEKAEQLCNCLPNEMKETIMAELEKAKANGGGDDAASG